MKRILATLLFATFFWPLPVLAEKFTVDAGATSVMDDVFILDSTSTTGAGKTGLTNASVTAYYHRTSDATATVINLTGTCTIGSFTAGCFKEIDSTNLPGWYAIHWPNAMFAAGATAVNAGIKGAGIAPVNSEFLISPGVKIETGGIISTSFAAASIPESAFASTGTFDLGSTSTSWILAANAPLNDISGQQICHVPSYQCRICQSYNTGTKTCTVKAGITPAQNDNFTLGGIRDANLIYIDGSTSLATATLNLKKLNISNTTAADPGIAIASTSGDAVTVTSSGGNGDAVHLTGNGTGKGFDTNLSQAFLAAFFTTDSGQTIASAVNGSVVKEASGAGGTSSAGSPVASSDITVFNAEKTGVLAGIAQASVRIDDRMKPTLAWMKATYNAGTNSTLDVKLQHSPDGTNWSDVTGGAFTQVGTSSSTQSLVVATPLYRYVRVVITTAANDADYTIDVELWGGAGGWLQ